MTLIFRSADEIHKDENHARVFDSGECEPQLNLLAHAQLIELGIGSECGGHGKCGRDRIVIRTQDAKYFSQLTAVERLHLSDDEIKNGVRLACQCFPEVRDQTVEVLVEKLSR